MNEPLGRTLHVLVVRADGGAVIVDEHGRLPRLTVELDVGETTASGSRRLLPPWLGADLAVMELLFDEPPAAEPPADGTPADGTPADGTPADGTPAEDAAPPIPVLVDLAPPAPGWEPHPPQRWRPTSDIAPDTHAAFADRVTRLLDERRGRLPIHPLRSPWSRPDWIAEITGWIDRSLVAAGRPPSATVTQIRHWGLSALLRVTSGDDVVWCKAVFPGFPGEPAVTALLHRDSPGTVAPVIAVDTEQRWLLMEDVGSATFEDRLGTPEPAIAAMADFHRRFVGRVDELIEAGLPDRRLRGLPTAVADALTDPDLAATHGLSPQRVAEVLAWLDHTVGLLNGLGLPDTLVHGDFHPGNVVSTDAGIVVFDWSDAAVSCPVIDVATWQWWCEDDACRDRTWEAFLAAWHGLVDPIAATRHRSRLEGVAAAHHVVSYAGILRGLEPDRRSDQANGLAEFARRLSLAVPS